SWLCFVGCVLALMLSHFASANEVDFAIVGIVAPQEQFTIAPSAPSSSDAIHFFDPYDQQGYQNACIAATELGLPQIAVNESEHQIAISFVPFSDRCSDHALLVSGLSGEFGPLSPGEWTYQTPLASHTFTVVPEPALVGFVVPVAVAMGGRRRGVVTGGK